MPTTQDISVPDSVPVFGFCVVSHS